jgi:hypothetical protein
LIKFASKLHRIAASEKILIAPLDWGLGHASRLVPLIRQELAKGHEVHLGLSGDAGRWLGFRFPELPQHELPTYGIIYHPKVDFVRNMRRQAYAIHSVQHHEYHALKELQKQIKFDKVISDNRYGLFHRSTENIILTHQIFPQASRLTMLLLHRYIHNRLRRFDQCWVPDYACEPEALSGALSHGDRAPVQLHFIGPLSRFGPLLKQKMQYQQVVLLSCPEPLRTAWEQQLIDTLRNATEKVALITNGAAAQNEQKQHIGALDVYYGLSDEAITSLLAAGQEIVCNAGYSTLMDMHAMGIRPHVFATPGQTEQEYLLRYLHQKNKIDIAAHHFHFKT